MKLLINKDGAMEFNFADDIVNNACITNGGKIISEIIKKQSLTTTNKHGNIPELHSEQH
jgi:hypothetical protein